MPLCVQGFVPYYMLNPQRLRDLAAAEGQEVSPGEAPATPAGGWTALKGQKLRVKVGQVRRPQDGRRHVAEAAGPQGRSRSCLARGLAGHARGAGWR